MDSKQSRVVPNFSNDQSLHRLTAAVVAYPIDLLLRLTQRQNHQKFGLPHLAEISLLPHLTRRCASIDFLRSENS